jgi:hypothetical protein
VKWLVDPGLDGDVYAERPYLYGPAASSVNTLHIRGNGKVDGQPGHDAGLVFTEGGDEDGVELRKEKGVPESEAARKKHFLNEENRKEWEWEAGKIYGCDFFNPYLDFNGSSFVLLFFCHKFSLTPLRLRPTITGIHSPDHEILGRTRLTVSLFSSACSALSPL